MINDNALPELHKNACFSLLKFTAKEAPDEINDTGLYKNNMLAININVKLLKQ